MFCLALILISGKMALLRRALITRKTLLGLLASGCAVSVNWGSYIWAVTQGLALDASLGYYALPLVTMALGIILLRERLSLRQIIAVAVLVVAVALLSLDRGNLPWIVLVLPLSFGLYGFLRKSVAVDALVGVAIETMLLAPFALAYLLVQPKGGALLSGEGSIPWLLLLCGPVTTIPLVLFSFAARRLTLTTLGLLQYLNPSLQMLTAVILLGERLSRPQTITFVLIWLGLAIYSWPAAAKRQAS